MNPIDISELRREMAEFGNINELTTPYVLDELEALRALEQVLRSSPVLRYVLRDAIANVDRVRDKIAAAPG